MPVQHIRNTSHHIRFTSPHLPIRPIILGLSKSRSIQRSEETTLNQSPDKPVPLQHKKRGWDNSRETLSVEVLFLRASAVAEASESGSGNLEVRRRATAGNHQDPATLPPARTQEYPLLLSSHHSVPNHPRTHLRTLIDVFSRTHTQNQQVHLTCSPSPRLN
ncbi:uncharacterized protein EI97DRAFT_69100 [Westerdykella ornata]|uniref:Uncharacterized protein n=1 Tax=Westerdykella ornata TaxID=318751 RepID=A0A6A6JJ21_WESOR|nr:uncharacterized protein EI97DRAFT_69100 [Westerdykella ornata]KAF2275666.1 hypothetical protein EI97DRAFT_69100 [Westerdykella ornata]